MTKTLDYKPEIIRIELEEMKKKYDQYLRCWDCGIETINGCLKHIKRLEESVLVRDAKGGKDED